MYNKFHIKRRCVSYLVIVKSNDLETEMNDYVEYGFDPEDPKSYETIFGY